MAPGHVKNNKGEGTKVRFGKKPQLRGNLKKEYRRMTPELLVGIQPKPVSRGWREAERRLRENYSYFSQVTIGSSKKEKEGWIGFSELEERKIKLLVGYAKGVIGRKVELLEKMQEEKLKKDKERKKGTVKRKEVGGNVGGKKKMRVSWRGARTTEKNGGTGTEDEDEEIGGNQDMRKMREMVNNKE